MSRILLLFIITVVSLQGCGTLSPDECQTMDGYSVGLQDGLQGRTARPVEDFHKACAKPHDVTAQIAEYGRGRGQGLKQFCSARNGFQLGSKGVHYNGVCPGDAQQEFLAAYKQGKEIFDSELQIRRLAEILHVNRSQLRTLTATAQRKEAEIAAHDTASKRRAVLLAEMSDLQQTVAMVETEISGIEAALEEENRHLQNLTESAR